MFFHYGKRKVKIKTYSDFQQACKNCKAFGLQITVYAEYGHLYFIPFLPMGNKTVVIRCTNCQEEIFSEATSSHYRNITKTPYYFFSGLILAAMLIVSMINYRLNHLTQVEAYVKDPQVGDEYQIRVDLAHSKYYYFYKIYSIHGDTISAYLNTRKYTRFVSEMDADDYFTQDQKKRILKSETQQLFDQGGITAITREK